MAWYKPQHSCGHQGDRIQLYGKESGRRERLDAMGRYPCPECRVEEGQTVAKTRGWPDITQGSVKQIGWAAQIRGSLAPEDMTPDIQELIDTKTDSRWWIDNRDKINAIVRRRESRMLTGAEG
jgi:hypothetical protein